MGKMRSLSSILFKPRETAKPSCRISSSLSRPSSSSSWPWPSCKHPMTKSFREAAIAQAIDKTMNSSLIFDCKESCFAHSSDEEERRPQGGSFSTTLSEDSDGDTLLQEALIRGLRSDRLFFEPSGGTCSILPWSSVSADEAFGESAVALTFDSYDPYWDFRSSMEEMVAAHGRLRDLEGLEEMLQWYLRANAEKTHGFIVAAFLDLALSFVYTIIPSSSSSSSNTSQK